MKPIAAASTFSLFRHHRRGTLPSFSVFSSTAAAQPLTPGEYQPLNKASRSNLKTTSNPLNFIPHFISLAKSLTLNPKNFEALANLDSLLSHTRFFDSVTSVAVFEGLCRLKKLNRAKTVLLHLKDNLKVSPFFAYSLVSDCLVKDGKLDDVEIQWGDICGGYGINLSDYVIYGCKCGEFEEIKRVCERILMGSRGLERQSYLVLIGALCRYNEGLLAKSVLHETYSKGFRVDDITYIVMLQCFCRNGDLDGADWVLRQLLKEDFSIDICTYGSFFYGLCEAGKYREANKLFSKLLKRDCFTDSKAESLKEGRRAIFQLKCEGVVPEMMAYEMYFRALCSAGKLDGAETLLKKMMKKRAMPQLCIYGSFIKALFRANREEDAMKFFNAECGKGLVRPDEIAGFVIVQLCKKGKIDNAMKIFNEFSRAGTFGNYVILCNSFVG